MSAGLRAALLIASAMLGSSHAYAAGRSVCDMSLRVELTPDVPDARDAGFLSSLLSNEVDYQLFLRGKTDDSDIVVELRGPGPDYRCRQAIQTMSRDARVISIRVLEPGVV